MQESTLGRTFQSSGAKRPSFSWTPTQHQRTFDLLDIGKRFTGEEVIPEVIRCKLFRALRLKSALWSASMATAVHLSQNSNLQQIRSGWTYVYSTTAISWLLFLFLKKKAFTIFAVFISQGGESGKQIFWKEFWYTDSKAALNLMWWQIPTTGFDISPITITISREWLQYLCPTYWPPPHDDQAWWQSDPLSSCFIIVVFPLPGSLPKPIWQAFLFFTGWQ